MNADQAKRFVLSRHPKAACASEQNFSMHRVRDGEGKTLGLAVTGLDAWVAAARAIRDDDACLSSED